MTREDYFHIWQLLNIDLQIHQTQPSAFLQVQIEKSG